jgi:hypothetical protein
MAGNPYYRPLEGRKMNTTLEVKSVECINRNSIPPENETIADDCQIEKLISNLKSIDVYFRDKEVCPFNRGNWIIDMLFDNGLLFSLKLPKEMDETHVMKWIKPLYDGLDEYKKSKMN